MVLFVISEKCIIIDQLDSSTEDRCEYSTISWQDVTKNVCINNSGKAGKMSMFETGSLQSPALGQQFLWQTARENS